LIFLLVASVAFLVLPDLGFGPHHRATSRQMAVLVDDPLNDPHVDVQTLRNVLVTISFIPQGQYLHFIFNTCVLHIFLKKLWLVEI
jgi:hypothetical protein